MRSIGFIGVGNMGGAIAKSILNKKDGADTIYVFDADDKKKDDFAGLGAVATDSAKELTKASDVVFLGVKPDIALNVLKDIASEFNSNKILISMVSATTIEEIENIIGGMKIMRIMPNTPAMIGEGTTAVCSNNMSKADVDEAIAIIEMFGSTYVIEEDLMHCAIGVSGSSPAYTYMYIKQLMNSAISKGLPADIARDVAAHAVIGAAKMVLSGDESLDTLIDNVCSKGGTTIEAVNLLESNGFYELVDRGFNAAYEKSKAMSEENN